MSGAATLPRAVLARLEACAAAAQAQPRILVAALAAAYLAQISSLWYPTPDSAAYLSIAHSVARGDGLRAFGSAQLGYPPGYPLLAAPAFLVAPSPFLPLSLLAAALAALLAGAVYLWVRDLCGGESVLVAALAMTHVSLWEMYRRPLSEIAFTAALLWSCLLLTRLLQRRAWPTPREAAPAALLLAFTCLIREAGIAVTAGFAVAAARAARRERVPPQRAVRTVAAVAVPALVAVAAFTLREVAAAAHTADAMGTHWSGFAQSELSGAARLLEGARLRVAAVGQLLVPGMFKADGSPGVWLDFNMPLYGVLFALLGAGWWRLLRARDDVLALSFPFYFALYVAWPFAAGTRYLLPMWPLVVLCLWLLLRAQARLRRGLFAALFAAHAAIALAVWGMRDLPAAWRCNAHWNGLAALAAQTRPGATLGATAAARDCGGLVVSLCADKRLHDLAQQPDEIVALASEPIPAGYRRVGARVPWALLARRGAADGDGG